MEMYCGSLYNLLWPFHVKTKAVSVGCRFPLREIRVLCAAEGCR